LLHHFNLKIPLGDELLKPCSLVLQMTQAPYINRREFPMAFAPEVDRRIANAVFFATCSGV
jgi:hypothetical protein